MSKLAGGGYPEPPILKTFWGIAETSMTPPGPYIISSEMLKPGGVLGDTLTSEGLGGEILGMGRGLPGPGGTGKL